MRENSQDQGRPLFLNTSEFQQTLPRPLWSIQISCHPLCGVRGCSSLLYALYLPLHMRLQLPWPLIPHVSLSLEPAQSLSMARNSVLPPGESLLSSDSTKAFLKLVTETYADKIETSLDAISSVLLLRRDSLPESMSGCPSSWTRWTLIFSMRCENKLKTANRCCITKPLS